MSRKVAKRKTGRPRLARGQTCVGIGVSVPDRLLRRVDREAKRQAVARSTLIVQWITAALEAGKGAA